MFWGLRGGGQVEVTGDRCTGSAVQEKLVLEATAQQIAQGWPARVVLAGSARGQSCRSVSLASRPLVIITLRRAGDTLWC